MDYLSFNAAVVAQQAVIEAIKRIEHSIESCGALTHQDAKQSLAAKGYFARQLESFKRDVADLRRFAADLGAQTWQARTQEQE